jgi:hypothetical protein
MTILKRRTIMRMLRSLLFLLVCTVNALGQSNAVNWSAFSSGFVTPKSGTTAISSIIGQSFSGRATNPTTAVTTGFLARPNTVTSVGDLTGSVPLSFGLSQNFPNPFNPSTVIRFEVATASRVTLKVYDVLGREVASLVEEEKVAGVHKVIFHAANMASGVYFYRLQANGTGGSTYVETRKLVLLR